jgi:hypothetical protein
MRLYSLRSIIFVILDLAPKRQPPPQQPREVWPGIKDDVRELERLLK